MKKFLLIVYIFACVPSAQGQIISTVAGIGVGAFSGDGGPATSAMIHFPVSMIFDSMDNLYFSDMVNGRVRKIDTAGIISTVAGDGGVFSGGDGGPATNASLIAPNSLARDSGGNLYIAESAHERVRKVNAAGIISTVAGTGVMGDTGDGGPATNATMYDVNGLARDHAGNMYIAYTNKVRKVNSAGIITAFAGSSIGGFSGDGGAASAALFHNIGDMAIDTAGNMYLIDNINQRIRKVNSSGIVSTVAGNGILGFTGDGGPATDASLAESGLALDHAGNVYIADARNFRVRKVNPLGIITTVAGNGIVAYAGDGGPAIAASFRSPDYVAFNSKGDMYVSDRDDDRIRLIKMPRILIRSTLSNKICVAKADTFSASVTNDAMTPIYEWQLNGAAVGANTPIYITDTLHNGDVVRCVLRYVFGDTVSKGSNAITITVDSLPPSAGTLAGAGSVCKDDSITLAYTVAGGIWSSSNSNAGAGAGIVHGLHAGADTIMYVVTNGCGTDTALHIVLVKDCLVPVAGYVKQQLALKVWPNPNNGSFTLNIISTASEEARIVITNVMGEKIRQLTVRTNEQTSVRLGAQTGIYFVTAVTQGGVWSGKIFVE